MINEVITFAQQQGYDSAIYLEKWRKYKVYEPVFNNEGVNIVGLPLMILVDGNKIRMTTADEAFAYLDEMC